MERQDEDNRSHSFRSTMTGGALPLALGSCRVVVAESTKTSSSRIRRRRHQDDSTDNTDENRLSVGFGPFLIHVPSSGNEGGNGVWFLCRRSVIQSPFLQLPENLCIDKSIRLDTNDITKLKSLFKARYDIQVEQRTRSTTACDLATTASASRPQQHSCVRLVSLTSATESNFTLITFQDPPTPVLSVALRVGGVTEADSSAAQSVWEPLLQSALKRQLVSCCFVWHEEGLFTTTIQINNVAGVDWNLTVKSVVVAAQTRQSPLIRKSAIRNNNGLYLISPNTRITLLLETTTPDRSLQHTMRRFPENTSSKSSPCAQMLIQTMECCLRQQQQVQPAQAMTVPRSFLLTGPPGVGKTHAVRVAVEYVSLKYGMDISTANKGDTQTDGTDVCRLIALHGSEILAEGSSIAAAALVLQREFERAVQWTQAKSHTNNNNNRLMDPGCHCRVALIFLDECDALLASSSLSTTEDSSVSGLAAMLACLLDQSNNDREWNRLVIVAATNRVDSIPEFLRRPGRFDREIALAPPNALERASILESFLLHQQLDARTAINSTDGAESFQGDNNIVIPEMISSDEVRDIADACVGYVPADLSLLVRRAKILQLTNKQSEASFADTLRLAMNDVDASALRDAALTAPPQTTWNDIAGDPGGAKTALQQAIEWPRTKSFAYKRLGLQTWRGILLHGPPGCSKTTLARAAAGASGVAFLSLAPADVYASSYVGEAEAVVRRAFTLARSAAPCVLFFDEIDAIIGAEESGSARGVAHGMQRNNNSAEARVLSTFLNEMDGVDGSWEDGVLVLGATNRPWTLDAAVLRPGRFDKVIYVPPPDFCGRRSILEMQYRKWQSASLIRDDEFFDLGFLASDSVSGRMTGAEIVGACRETAMHAIRRALAGGDDLPMVTYQCLLEALQSVKPLLSDEFVMSEYQAFALERC